jgi:hypothetical protein
MSVFGSDRERRAAKANGSEGECGPGDAVYIAPGHDAWTVGDEACVLVDFGQIQNYAKAQ